MAGRLTASIDVMAKRPDADGSMYELTNHAIKKRKGEINAWGPERVASGVLLITLGILGITFKPIC